MVGAFLVKVRLFAVHALFIAFAKILPQFIGGDNRQGEIGKYYSNCCYYGVSQAAVWKRY
ncbi:hypothetical protein D7V90_11635 [bacterium 1xD42-87]|jgi:hypothetical protein|nr:hypothetical protein D7V90_11635 [bacterium 1xD42-87]